MYLRSYFLRYLQGIYCPLSGRITSILIVGIFLASCQTTSNFTSEEGLPIPTREMSLEQEYRLESGDKLALKFFNNFELNDQILVGPDGNASLQLVGNIRLAGRTLSDVEGELVNLYDAHIVIPKLTLSLTEVSTQRVFVGGEVARPGMYESDGGLTLVQAIFMAGGYSSTGKLSSVVVLRDNGDPVLDYYIVNVGENISTLANFQDLRLQGRDIVYIPKTQAGSISQFLNVHLAGIKEIMNVFNFTVTYETRNQF
ncbi:MAG: hypothetical protein COA73_00885 [Candidatus Hydrogenedentota bacterium]|nr:MAG: hypothetical protein COA73_00885 [Candidatus Hydrogenedentota bacterium]